MKPEFWAGRRVFVTGHTGFKGAWLCQWLAGMGAEVTGYALEPEAQSLHGLLRTPMRSIIGDINDRASVKDALEQSRPEIVLHLAAQALVRPSYADPVTTFASNVLGVVTLLDLLRSIDGLKAVVVVTSDKCYENQEWHWGYREIDPMGGRDPYSASKGCAEIAVRSMQRSYFAPYAAAGHPARIATARAGNVIGGGDWSTDRLVPDIVRGCLSASGQVTLRSPGSVRPWQHVLEPLRGYLDLAEMLVADGARFDQAWNFGPDAANDQTVAELTRNMIAALGQGKMVCEENPGGPHEARLLTLDCSKAKAELGWKPRLGFDGTVRMTAEWYKAWHTGLDPVALTRKQIADYTSIL